MPSVPPAAIRPDDNCTSYFERVMGLPAMIPRIVTDAPTMPVAAANTVATNITARYSEPVTRARIFWIESNRRSIRFACSIMMPMNTNSGTAASVCSIMEP